MNCVNEVAFVDKFRARSTDWQTALEGHCSLMWNEANVIANADFPTGYKGLFLAHGMWRQFFLQLRSELKYPGS